MQFVQIMRNVTDMIPEAMRKKMPLTKKFDEYYQVDKKSDTEDDDTNEQNEEIENDRERERGGRGFREIDDDER